ncbi:MAG: hypothetical protein JO040_13655 [Gemmatimonadetes bacterium]|nr:hypothetical protein [Gemmatimonadota bacterium]
MSQRVLILAPDNDFHALSIQALLRGRGADADIVDTARFPESLVLVQRGGASTEVLLDGKPLSGYHSVWWRRPHPPTPPAEVKVPEERRFASREAREALWGAIHAAGLPIYNSPQAEARAGYKPYQLRVAQECGLRVPETLITNSAEEVAAFRERHPRVVYKAFSATTLAMTDTRPLSEGDLPDLWRLRYAPVIFQEYVELGREYRVTLVEDAAFAVEITLQHPAAHYDWRIDPDYRIAPAEVPPAIVEGLQRVRRALELNSGSADLRETPEGEIYFLEINPSGQFLFLDVFAGMDVGNPFCDMLLQ